MPKIYVRTQPKTGLKTRHRCGMGFTDVWKELEDIDAATRAALEEDPYLEVSETPTVLVEVAAAVQSAAPEASGNPIQPTESTAQQDSADAAQGESEQAGTASAADEQSTESNDVKDAGLDGAINGHTAFVSESQITASGGDSEEIQTSQQETQVGQDETKTELSAAETTQASVAEVVGGEKTEHQLKIDVIKASINTLDVANPDNWVADGKPKAAMLTVLLGYPVSAEDRDEAWAQIQAARSAG
ncbi:hypothetical protein ACH5Y9_05365 [Methylomonas sp. BW4-1]|uniref:hypothetical protein n=1 Tax=Methylomonas sp. BW4-1 TaxID=3376685 RepID=UPI004041A731